MNLFKWSLLVGSVAFSLSSQSAQSSFQPDFDRIWCCQELAAPSVKNWVQNENQIFKSQIQSSPMLAAIQARAQQLAGTNAPLMVEVQGRYFYTAKGSLWMKESANSTPIELASPQPQEKAVVGDFRVSPDSKKVAFSYVPRGGDTQFWSVLDIESRQIVSGPPIRVRVENVTWDLRSKGIFYSRWPQSATEEYQLLRRHKRQVEVWYRPLYTTGQDVRIFSPQERPQNMIYSVAELIPGKLFLAHRTQGPAEIGIMAYLIHRQNGTLRPIRLTTPQQYFGKYLGARGSEIFFRTTEVGSKFGVLAYNYMTGQKRVVVAGSNKDTLTTAYFNGENLVLHYLTSRFENIVVVTDTQSPARVLFKTDFRREFQDGVAYLSSGFVASPNSKKVYFSGSSLLNAPRSFELDLSTSRIRLTALPNSNGTSLSSDRINQQLVYINSMDGQVQIPVFVYTRKDLQRAPNFLYMFFYGAIGTAQPPWWNRKLQLALEMGGAVAVPLIRGGGELGRTWTEMGEINRFTTLSDIAQTSRVLRKQLNLTADRVVISARSLGGLHVLGAMTHFQDDFGLFFPTVPISDPGSWVTEGLFAQYATDDFGIRRNQIDGSLVNYSNDVARLQAWSPIHNISKMKKIKPVVFFTGENDERVSPVQSYRMVTRLRDRFGANAPVFVYTEMDNGHLARTELIDEMTYLAKHYNIQTLDTLFR